MTYINEYIHRMLVYWDPWGLINNGAPNNEYDSYIQALSELVYLQNADDIREKLSEIFTLEGMPTHNVERAIDGMVEGINYLRKSN